MYQGTFSSKFGNVQSGQHYCEGKMSIPGKHFGGQNPVLNIKGMRAKRYAFMQKTSFFEMFLVNFI